MEENFRFESVNGLAKALGGRIDLLEKIFGKKVRDNLKYSDIQKIVKSGFASEFFDLGDEIMTKYTATDGTVYDFPWRIVDFRDVYWENDPNPHPGMVLQAKYATAEKVPYDAPPEGVVVDRETEPTALEGMYYYGNGPKSYDYTELHLNLGDPIPFDDYLKIYKLGISLDATVLSSGTAIYKFSVIRQWLNSSAGKNEWWAPTHVGDNAPSELSTINGFLAGFPSEFINLITPTKISVFQKVTRYINNKWITLDQYVDSTYDKMFLPSAEEMYGFDNTDTVHAAGPCFQYWKEKIGSDLPTNDANSARIVTTVSGSTDLPYAFLRSSNAAMSSRAHGLNNGKVDGVVSVQIPIHALPCCVIS